jgi:hypothetical protein
MKKYFVGTLMMFSILLALAAGAQAESNDVVVHIRQAFVAGGKALPAGTYRIHQDFSGVGEGLVLSGDAGASALLLPISHDEALNQGPEVKLMRVGDLYYLSEVTTGRGVYTLALPTIDHNTARTTGLDRTSSPSSGSN